MKLLSSPCSPPFSSHPSPLFPTLLVVACAAPPCILPPQCHCVPGAAIPIFPQASSFDARCKEKRARSQISSSQCPAQRVPRDVSSFWARCWGPGGLALTMSLSSFHRELDARVRAITHRLKQSVEQDNSINCSGSQQRRARSTALPEPGEIIALPGASHGLPSWGDSAAAEKSVPQSIPRGEEAALSVRRAWFLHSLYSRDKAQKWASVASSLRVRIPSLYSTLMRPHLECCIQLRGSQHRKDTDLFK